MVMIDTRDPDTWRPPKKPHKSAKWFAKEGWEWSWAMLFGHFAAEGINCLGGDDEDEAGGSSPGAGRGDGSGSTGYVAGRAVYSHVLFNIWLNLWIK